MTVHTVEDGSQYTVEMTVPLHNGKTNQNLTVYVVAKTFEQAHATVRAEFPDGAIHKINKSGNYWTRHVLLVDDAVFDPTDEAEGEACPEVFNGPCIKRGAHVTHATASGAQWTNTNA